MSKLIAGGMQNKYVAISMHSEARIQMNSSQSSYIHTSTVVNSVLILATLDYKSCQLIVKIVKVKILVSCAQLSGIKCRMAIRSIGGISYGVHVSHVSSKL